MNGHHVKTGRFMAATADMYDIDYHAGGHEWCGKTPEGALMGLQSNDMFGDEVHVNGVAGLDAFKRQAAVTSNRTRRYKLLRYQSYSVGVMRALKALNSCHLHRL